MINRRPNRGATTPEQRAQMKWKRDMEETPEQCGRRREQIKAAKVRRRLENPRREMLDDARRNPKLRGIEFDLKETDLEEWPTHCPVLKIKLPYPGRFRGDPAMMVFERINNELGYLPGNVIIVSQWVNLRKGDATPAQLLTSTVNSIRFAVMSRHHGQFMDAVKVVRGMSALISCVLTMTTRAGPVGFATTVPSLASAPSA